MQLQHCFLLSYVKYGDNDAVLHCFSRDSGYQSFFVKGIYSSKNKKKAYLIPLNQLILNVVSKRNLGGMPVVSKIEMRPQDYLYDEVKINTVLMFVADFLNQVLRNETSENFIYEEIEKFTHELFTGNYNAYVAFIYKILHLQGLSPLNGNEAYLDPESGNFTSEKSNNFFDLEISSLWKEFIVSDNVYKVSMSRKTRSTFLDSLMMFYKIHFSNFHEPHSLDIIQQLYE